MIGDLLIEEQGQITTMRVLPISEGHPPNVEISFEARGRLLGTDMTDLTTYQSAPRPDGTLHGKGQGVIMTADGAAIVWEGQGTGRMSDGGGMIWRGALFFSTDAERFSRMNGIVGVFEHESDADGKLSSKIWEWK